jgi:glycosyl transferase, family 25
MPHNASMKIFIISLTDAAARRARMSEMMSLHGLKFEYLDAVRGSTVDAATLARFSNLNSMLLSPGEFGCLLSHIEAWRRLAVDDETSELLVMEDDVHISPNFKDVISGLRIDSEEIALYKLETMLASVDADRTPMQRLGKHQIHRIFTTHAGTAAYALSKATARHLLDHSMAMTRAVDTELFSPNRRTIPYITVYQCIPAPCIQDMLIPGSRLAELSSQISEREDKRLGIMKTPSGIKTVMKNLLRPAYLSWVSHRLKKMGKFRTQVKFG